MLFNTFWWYRCYLAACTNVICNLQLTVTNNTKYFRPIFSLKDSYLVITWSIKLRILVSKVFFVNCIAVSFQSQTKFVHVCWSSDIFQNGTEICMKCKSYKISFAYHLQKKPFLSLYVQVCCFTFLITNFLGQNYPYIFSLTFKWSYVHIW